MARSTMKGFSTRIRAIAVGVEVNTDALVRKVALAVDRVVVTQTPVDTGRARANWQAAIGAAPGGEVGQYPAGAGGATGAAAAAQAIAQAQGVVAGYKGGEVIHLTNNLPYIQRLNEGHSDQAPAGFVQAGIDAAIRAVKRAKIIKG